MDYDNAGNCAMNTSGFLLEQIYTNEVTNNHLVIFRRKNCFVLFHNARMVFSSPLKTCISGGGVKIGNTSCCWSKVNLSSHWSVLPQGMRRGQ